MSERKSVNKVDVFGNAINVAFNLVWPIGVTYPQYPGEKSPMDLWGEFSTWEPINYNGAFFRAAGGNANPWIEVTTTNGRNFTIKEGRTVPLNSALKYGATVMFNGESRTVNNVVGSGSNITSFSVNSAFTEPSGGYKNITNVYILQDDATDVNGLSLKNSLLSDYQWLGRAEWNNGFGSTIEKGGTAGDPSTGGKNPPEIDYAVGPFTTYIYPMKYNLQHSHTITSKDNETRPANSTYIIWRRTA